MRKRNAKGHDGIQAESLEEMLNTLPRKELPSHLEERILASVRSLRPVDSRPRPGLRYRLQWAAISLGACGFIMLGALMAWTVTRTDDQVQSNSSTELEAFDPGLTDYIDVFGA